MNDFELCLDVVIATLNIWETVTELRDAWFQRTTDRK